MLMYMCKGFEVLDTFGVLPMQCDGPEELNRCRPILEHRVRYERTPQFYIDLPND